VEVIAYPESAAQRTAALQRRARARTGSPSETRRDDDAVVLRRIDHLVELGKLLVRLTESATEDEHKPGRLPGSFYVTRLPLLLKEVELSLSALRALGGQPPLAVVALVQEPDRFRQNGSAAVLSALVEINEAIAGESLASPAHAS
jgi:hypothetical protein